jgi:protoporphyrin/coproporphyrin ferrochelatase
MTAKALESMKEDGVERAIALSLYPQYSCSTTGSSLNELTKSLKEMSMEKTFKWSVVDRWFNNPGLVNTFASHIEKSLAEYPEADREKVVLLFSAHSLPMSVVNRGGLLG